MAPPSRDDRAVRPLRGALVVLLVVTVGAAAKLPETVLPISSDTGMYATYARMILEGKRPYVNFFDVHPPLTYYYWTFVEAVAGTDWSRTCIGSWGVLAPQPCVSLLAHALDLGLTCLGALLVYAIARRLDQPASASSQSGIADRCTARLRQRNRPARRSATSTDRLLPG